MKKTMLAIMMIMLLTTAAYAKGFEASKQAGPFKLDITMDKNPPATGDNNITVLVKDAAGKPVKDAKVNVDYGMPAMPGMPAMNYKTDPVGKDGKFTGKLNFSMPGAWSVEVKVEAAGKKGKSKLNIDVR
jgi:nitrogen fixation protein FixH